MGIRRPTPNAFEEILIDGPRPLGRCAVPCARRGADGADRPRIGQAGVRGRPRDRRQSPIIWEAFKPDTEPRRSIGQGEMDAKARVLAALEQARARRLGPGAQAQRNAGPPGDFVEEQGGIY